MPNTSIDSELRTRVDAFVADLTEIIRQAALDSVRDALGAEAAPARRGSGRPRKAAKRAVRKAPKRAGRGGRRVRRSSEDLAKLSGAFLSYVKGNSGQRLEEIGAGMGIDTKELKRPVQLLMEAGSVRTEGQRRGTRYFAGGSRRGKGAKRKVSKRGKRTKRAKTAKRKASRKKSTKKAAA